MLTANEFFISVFMAYPHAHFRYEGSLNTTREMIGISQGGNVIDTNNETFKIDKCRLVLRPLTMMSDKDAIRLLEIRGWQPKHFSLEDQIAKGKEFALSVSTSSDIETTIGGRCIWAVDYLRSKGYDCGYMDVKSLIASGIAINMFAK